MADFRGHVAAFFPSASAPIREPVYSDTATDGMKERTGKNAAPITGELDVHPVGTGVEAAGGAVTGAALGTAIGGPIGVAVT